MSATGLDVAEVRSIALTVAVGRERLPLGHQHRPGSPRRPRTSTRPTTTPPTRCDVTPLSKLRIDKRRRRPGRPAGHLRDRGHQRRTQRHDGPDRGHRPAAARHDAGQCPGQRLDLCDWRRHRDLHVRRDRRRRPPHTATRRGSRPDRTGGHRCHQHRDGVRRLRPPLRRSAGAPTRRRRPCRACRPRSCRSRAPMWAVWSGWPCCCCSAAPSCAALPTSAAAPGASRSRLTTVCRHRCNDASGVTRRCIDKGSTGARHPLAPVRPSPCPGEAGTGCTGGIWSAC